MTGCCSNLDQLLIPKFFKALGDPTRVSVLAKLAQVQCAATVTQVAEWFPVDISVVSRHLGVLREAGIVTAERHGKEVRYCVCYGPLVRTLRQLADAIEACCPEDSPHSCGCSPISIPNPPEPEPEPEP